MKVKYRGDFIFHWGFYKKSLRVKTRKQNLYNGMRRFNLIVPNVQLNNLLGYQLAREMGLIAPKSELVNVIINGKWRGIYVLVEQLEELTLRRHNVMPGDLYAGELLARDRYRGINNRVFEHPRVWKKISFNNHYPEESHAPLEKFIGILGAADSEDEHQILSRMIDLDAWGRFSAFETLGRSFHYDTAHNWRLYYDPAKNFFMPIIWDPNCWSTDWVEKGVEKNQLDVMPSDLHTFLYQNTDFLRAKQKAIESFFKLGKDKIFLRRVEREIKNMVRTIPHDPDLLPLETDKAISGVQSVLAIIKKVFYDVKQGYLQDSGAVQFDIKENNATFGFKISGRPPVKRVIFRYLYPVPKPLSVTIRYWTNGKPSDVDVTSAVHVRGTELSVDTQLYARFVQVEKGSHPLKKFQMDVLPAYYELHVDGLEQHSVHEILVSRGMAGVQTAKKVKKLEPVSFRNQFRIVHAQPVKIPQVWSGERIIRQVIDIYDEVIIKPGSKILLGKGAGLIFHKRVTANGTGKQPVRFIPLNEKQDPWGAVVLLGQGVNGSHFSYCEFAGGSGLKEDLFEYSAMFSVHDVKDVSVKNCRFRDSRIVDDMVHTVYSNIKLEDSEFYRSKSDAIDFDISKAIVKNCRFVDSGNDALDLMATEAIIIDTFIMNSGDKGVSVGEASRLLAINDQLVDNLIGIQAKDGSVATLYNLTLDGNAQALDAYKKNWRYNNGGRIFLYKGRFENNEKMISADKKSTIWIYDSFIDRPVKTKKKRVLLDDSVDMKRREQARVNKFWRFSEETELLKDLGVRYWNKVNPGRRGATGIARH